MTPKARHGRIPEMAEPLHWSLAYFKAKDYRIIVYCPNGHGAPVDLDVAIKRFGADFLIVEGRARFLAGFRCERCGQRATELILSPGNTGPAV